MATKWGVKVKYPSGRTKVLTPTEGTSYAHAESLKINLMTRTQEEDTEYYVVPLERNK